VAKGNRIIVTPHPRGRFEEVIVVGTPKPGTVMAIVPTTNTPVGGRYNYEPAGATAASGSQGMSADGDNIPICVLLCFIDHVACPPGKGATDAYVTGERGAVYYPEPGEELNVLFQNASGTADDVRIADKLIVDDGTGKVLVSTGSVESEPFEAQEALTDPTADTLIWCKYTAN
jgi:hypothetical protein